MIYTSCMKLLNSSTRPHVAVEAWTPDYRFGPWTLLDVYSAVLPGQPISVPTQEELLVYGRQFGYKYIRVHVYFMGSDPDRRDYTDTVYVNPVPF